MPPVFDVLRKYVRVEARHRAWHATRIPVGTDSANAFFPGKSGYACVEI